MALRNSHIPHALIAALLLSASACKDLPAGMNTKSSATMAADDGDDTDGPPRTDTYPSMAAVDALSLSASHPIDFRQFITMTVAQVGGPKTSRIATAHATGKTTSYFDVDRLWRSETIEFEIHTLIEANVTSGSDTVSYTLAVNTASGAPVVAPMTYTYSLGPTAGNAKQLDVKLGGTLIGTIAQGGRFDDVRTVGVTFKNGGYRFDLSWDATSIADGHAEAFADVWIVSK